MCLEITSQLLLYNVREREKRKLCCTTMTTLRCSFSSLSLSRSIEMIINHNFPFRIPHTDCMHRIPEFFFLSYHWRTCCQHSTIIAFSLTSLPIFTFHSGCLLLSSRSFGLFNYSHLIFMISYYYY